MSYEGYTEYLCANGHWWAVDAYDVYERAPSPCEICGGTPVWQHSVDQTNGMDPDDPHTMPYPLKVARWETVEIQRPIYEVPE